MHSTAVAHVVTWTVKAEVNNVCFVPLAFQYYALQILETVIKTRWKILPRNQCEGECEPLISFYCLFTSLLHVVVFLELVVLMLDYMIVS